MINKVASLVCAVRNDLKLPTLFTSVNNVVSVTVGTAIVAAVMCQFARQKAVAEAKQVKSAEADLICKLFTSTHLKSTIVLTFLLFGNVGRHNGFDKQHRLGISSTIGAAAGNTSPQLVETVLDTVEQSSIRVGNAVWNHSDPCHGTTN